MTFLTKEQKKMLGVSSKEGHLLDVLTRHGSLNTSVLAYEARLPRVTVMRVLKHLHTRDLVIRREEGKEVVWQASPKSLLQKKVVELFETPSDRRGKHIELSEVGNLRVYQGTDAMIESNRRMLVAHPGERVLAIEPNGIWKHFAKVQSKEVHELNLLWGNKKILVEMVAEEGFEEVIKSHINPDIEFSFMSLVVDTRVVPKGILDSSTEILIFRDQILFLDWAHLVAVEIQDPSTVRVMKAMYRMLQKSGKVYRSE